MNCEKIQQELVAYLDGELGKAAADEVRKHLERCPACKLEAERLSAAGGFFDKLGEIEPARDFTARVMRRALNAPAQPATARLRMLRRFAPVAAAAAILFVLTLWLVAPSIGPGLTPVEEEIVQNLEVLENLELLEDMEILSELDLLLEYEEEDFESS